jgi:hypothetical protein
MASVNDWRAILIVAISLIASLIGFIIWRELNLVRLAKAIDKMTEAIWGVRLALAELRAERRDEEEKKGAS